MPEEEINLSKKQKLIAFVNVPENIEAMFELFKLVNLPIKLLGDNEFHTLVNTIRFDTRETMVFDLIQKIQFIKDGGLNQVDQ